MLTAEQAGLKQTEPSNNCELFSWYVGSLQRRPGSIVDLKGEPDAGPHVGLMGARFPQTFAPPRGRAGPPAGAHNVQS